MSSAVSELDKVQRNLKYMRDNTAPMLQIVIDEWLEILLPIRKDIRAELVFKRNPFNPSTAIQPDPEGVSNVFTGRKDIKEQIESDILGANSPPTLLLYGPRRMGKTSILFQLPVLLGRAFAPVRIDFQNVANVASLESLLRHITNATRESLKLQRITVEPLNEDLQQNPFAVFSDWLQRAEESMRPEMRILLCFDEYEQLDVINLHWPKQFLDSLRSILQVRQRIIAMFTGVKTFKDLGREWIARFPNAKQIRVSFLTFNDVRLLVEEPTPDYGITYDPQVVETLYRHTRGQPFLTQAVAFELFNILRKRRSLVGTMDDLKLAIDKTIKTVVPYFTSVWQDAGERGQVILSALVQGLDPVVDAEAMQLLQQNDVLNVKGQFHVPMVAEGVKKLVSGELERDASDWTEPGMTPLEPSDS